MEGVDAHVIEEVASWRTDPDRLRWWTGPQLAGGVDQRPDRRLRTYFQAQLESRHLDLAARWLQARGEGFYTIGSSGHEANAAVALATRPTDPALLHYRSGAFYCARAHQRSGSSPVDDIVASLTCSELDPISGGRHKVFGNHDLSIIPQTSTIGSHLPRAVGLAFALDRARVLGRETPWPHDAIVVASMGDASANHSTSVGALNAAAWCARQRVPVPLLVVVEDNRVGISVPSPSGWLGAVLPRYPAVGYARADGRHPEEVLRVAQEAADQVRERRAPMILHLATVRLGGHAGSDAEIAYRTPEAIANDRRRDPLLATAAMLVAAGALDPDGVLREYERVRSRVMSAAEAAYDVPRLSSAEAVMAPLIERRPSTVRRESARVGADRVSAWAGQLPETGPPLTLAGAINATLVDVLAAHDDTLVFGEDVAVKGGVYGVTRGLRKRFGAGRVFDTLLDEQSILGTALGTALADFLPICEIQYLAYLHNAEDQLRGEAGSLKFFSNGQYRNGMVVRVPGLAYQRGFGGHFHNDNSVAVLRDIPGVVVAVPSHPAEVPGLLRACVGLAKAEGRVCVFLEPIALYHRRDLRDGDGRWLAPYWPPDASAGVDELGKVTTHGSGRDLLILTFGNGVAMSLAVVDRLAEAGIAATVTDLRWLSPLPEQAMLALAARYDHVLVVDETRRSGGVSEGIVAALLDGGFTGSLGRVTSLDSYLPLGPAATTVLLSQDEIVSAALQLCAAKPRHL